jgi:hypothetical protein
MSRTIFTFDTTHHALWAEEVAKDAGIPHEVVPSPPAAQARCSIAVETLPADAARFEAMLATVGIETKRFIAESAS